tara:strand:- start:3602 stop:4060 length:459 start_codon:yes stop_codon:yes gene_type:complete
MKINELNEHDVTAFMSVIRRVQIFKLMTIGQIEKVLPYLQLCLFEKNEVICEQGKEGDAFYMIQKGEVEVSVKTGYVSFKKVVSKLGSHDFFGEISLFRNVRCTATVRCKKPSYIYVLSKQDFNYVLSVNPDFRADIERIVQDRKNVLKKYL